MTRHQNGISAVVSQTSFRGEAGSGVAKCRLFSQSSLFRKPPDVLNTFFLVCLFQLPEDFQVLFDDAAGELIIGGIYLRLFIQQPAWVSVMNVSICPNTKRELEPKCFPQLFLVLLLETRRSAVGQYFISSPRCLSVS